jgi:radical SAM superfamily enzyme YgiQ (UPF0313 family)
MRKAGFYSFIVAIESGSQYILNRNNKKLNLKNVRGAMELAKSMGFFLLGYVIFGLPGETYETARRTIQFAKTLPYNAIATFIAKPLPGSNWWKELAKTEDVEKIDPDWFQFLLTENQYELSDGKRTMKLPIDAYHEYFFRPIQIWRYLRFWINTFHFRQSILGVVRRIIKQALYILGRK